MFRLQLVKINLGSGNTELALQSSWYNLLKCRAGPLKTNFEIVSAVFQNLSLHFDWGPHCLLGPHPEVSIQVPTPNWKCWPGAVVSPCTTGNSNSYGKSLAPKLQTLTQSLAAGPYSYSPIESYFDETKIWVTWCKAVTHIGIVWKYVKSAAHNLTTPKGSLAQAPACYSAKSTNDWCTMVLPLWHSTDTTLNHIYLR